MLSEKQIQILREQAKITADKYISRPIEIKRREKKDDQEQRKSPHRFISSRLK